MGVLVISLCGAYRQVRTDSATQEQSGGRLHHAGTLDRVFGVIVVRQRAAVAIDLTVVDMQGSSPGTSRAGANDAIGFDITVFHGQFSVVRGQHCGADGLKVIDALPIQLEIGIGDGIFAIPFYHDPVDEFCIRGKANSFG